MLGFFQEAGKKHFSRNSLSSPPPAGLIVTMTMSMPFDDNNLNSYSNTYSNTSSQGWEYFIKDLFFMTFMIFYQWLSESTQLKTHIAEGNMNYVLSTFHMHVIVKLLRTEMYIFQDKRTIIT